jgi:predicted secreted protein
MANCPTTGDAIWAYGTTLWRSDGDANNPQWERVTYINQINPPGGSTAEIETTHHDTPDGFTTFISGLKTTDDIEMVVNWQPTETSHRILYDDWIAGCNRDWKIEVKSNGNNTIATFEVTAFVMSFSIETPIDGRAVANVTLKPSGKPTFQ